MRTEQPDAAVYIAHLRPGQRVRWQSRYVADNGRMVLLDIPATLIKPVAGHAKRFWVIQVDGEDEQRHTRIGELSDDFVLPDAIPDYLPSPWNTAKG